MPPKRKSGRSGKSGRYKPGQRKSRKGERMPARQGRALEAEVAAEKAAKEALVKEVATLKAQADAMRAEAAMASNSAVEALRAQNAALCAEVSALKLQAVWADRRIQTLECEVVAERNMRLAYEAEEEERQGRNRVARRFLRNA